ncbi:MAG TPA: endonuclease/exonuclease/phosphatase family protein, partial [Candidatus Sumerlaeota bacterium]|nr:endonuclease/exonuclease/phosphatase family protein [Candidatus Sumerlaeota bacterium]
MVALAAMVVASAGFANAQTTRIRLMAANITSGNNQSYDPGHGTRIFQGLDPDIIMIQEFNYGSDSTTDIRNFVNLAFGSSFQYFREAGGGIPNGVISRYPILEAGEWEDTNVSDREFVWAKIDVPGDKNLWAISVHLLTSSSSNRNNQATLLKNFINAKPIPATDYLVIGGDFNTDNRTESCINTLSSLVVTSGPYPSDGTSNSSRFNTNAGRNKPYDWVLVNSTLSQYGTGVVIGSRTFTNGLVFDSRVYSPLSEVSPVLSGDSGATNMQHMAVV